MLRIPDRFWWVQRYGGKVFAVGCLIAAIYAAIQAYGAYSLAQVPVSDPNLQTLLRLDAQQLLLEGLAGGFFAVMGVVYVRASFRSRERFWLRQRAMQGEQDAMPRARVRVDADNAPDLAGEPLELLWRANSRAMITILTIIIVIFSPIAMLFFYLAYCIATSTPLIGSTYLEPVSPPERVLYAAVALGAGACFLFLVVFITRSLPVFRGKPYGVTATNDGLWDYPEAGRKRFLRWEELRLFEVFASRRGQRYREYKLYSRDALAAWSNVPPASILLSGLAMQEFEQHHQALLDLIAARTGLLPRTFEKELVDAASGV